jgi:uncharacterized protein
MTALVTGSTAGIGSAFAEILAEQGHDLVLVARNTERLESQAQQLADRFGIAAEVLPADLATSEGCRAVSARLTDARPVELLINNAGFGLNHPFRGGSLDAEEQLLDVLVRATLRLSHAAIPVMVERGSGTILNVSSIAAWVPMGTYSAAKAWVTAFSEGVALELRGTGVTVTAVCPGFTRTEFHERANMNPSQVPGWGWLDARTVAEQGLEAALRGQVISVPSTRYAIFAGLARTIPRAVLHRAIAASPNPLRK